MAKIRIHVCEKDPVWFQFDNLDAIESFLTQCGYGSEAIKDLADWATSPELGVYSALPGAEVHKERGNVETWDILAGNWISSPPEMEDFLAEIRSVCKKHGLVLCTEDGEQLFVQAYCEEDISRLDAAVKNYASDEIRKQPQATEPAERKENDGL